MVYNFGVKYYLFKACFFLFLFWINRNHKKERRKGQESNYICKASQKTSIPLDYHLNLDFLLNCIFITNLVRLVFFAIKICVKCFNCICKFFMSSIHFSCNCIKSLRLKNKRKFKCYKRNFSQLRFMVSS